MPITSILTIDGPRYQLLRYYHLTLPGALVRQSTKNMRPMSLVDTACNVSIKMTICVLANYVIQQSKELPHLHITIWNFRRNKEINGETVTGSALAALVVANEPQLPSLSHLLKIICCLPITSNEAERSFSKLKLLKSSLRSTMTNKR
jgi:hypothetical protein